MAGDTIQTFAPAMKYNTGGGVIGAVRKGRAAKRGQPQPLAAQGAGASPSRATPQQDTDRVRDALRLKPWL